MLDTENSWFSCKHIKNQNDFSASIKCPNLKRKKKIISHSLAHNKIKNAKNTKQPKEYVMLVEACHTTILIIISVAHSKKSKGFFRLKTTGDPRWFPEELRQLIII